MPAIKRQMDMENSAVIAAGRGMYGNGKKPIKNLEKERTNNLGFYIDFI